MVLRHVCRAPRRSTIVDCAAVITVDAIDALVDTALARRVVDIEALAAVAADRRLLYYPGRRSLEMRLAARGILGSPHPSVLESRMARVFRLHRLPGPKAEVVWGPNRRYRLDFAYPHLRLAIEVDGWSAHFAPEQQRHDNHGPTPWPGPGGRSCTTTGGRSPMPPNGWQPRSPTPTCGRLVAWRPPHFLGAQHQQPGNGGRFAVLPGSL